MNAHFSLVYQVNIETKHRKFVTMTLDILGERFNWPTMETMSGNVTNACISDGWKFQKTELNPIETTQPMELVHIDYHTIK